MTTPTATTIDGSPRMRPAQLDRLSFVLSRSFRVKVAAGLFFCAFCTACSSSPPPRQTKAEPAAERPSLLRPLPSHIPSAGLRWLVELKPRALMEHRRFRKDWEAVFAAEGIRAFTQASGADPSRIEEAWIAGYDLGQLYVFDARSVGQEAQKAFEARSMTTQKLESKDANIVHLTGMIEDTPHALVHIRDHLVAIASGDIRLARIVRAYAEGKLTQMPAALESRFLSMHSSFAQGALVRGFLLGPYENATDAVAASFVSGVGGVDFEGEELRVSAQALGVWEAGAELDSQLTRYTDELLSTRELRALGWGFPVQAPTVSCVPSQLDLALCSAKGAWESAAVAAALRRITAGSMKEIVDETPPGWHPEATTVQPSE